MNYQVKHQQGDICPSCASRHDINKIANSKNCRLLLKFSAKNGQIDKQGNPIFFLGCSEYPMCRYIVSSHLVKENNFDPKFKKHLKSMVNYRTRKALALHTKLKRSVLA